VELAVKAAGVHTGAPDMSTVGAALIGSLLYFVFALFFGTLQMVVMTAPAAAAYRDLAPRKDQSHVFG
jgi:hypothetical protein